jgi:ribosomal protein S18 acetylase RimI-like enzyme
MISSIEVRKADAHEKDAIGALVQSVVDEVYGNLWARPPLPIGNEDWSCAWIAVSTNVIVGMALTQEDWIDDLWVLGGYRNRGIGQSLLLKAQTEIANRGYPIARLRVVSSNYGAIRFYERAGWQVEREFRHESLPINMTEMFRKG